MEPPPAEAADPMRFAPLRAGAQVVLYLPRMGFGTWQLRDDGCKAAVATALASGYRSLDTASIYRNEEAVGEAVKEWEAAERAAGRSGEGVLITSKCSPYQMGARNVKAALASTLQKIGREALDLLLIHWPAAGKKPHASEEHRRVRHETWVAMEELLEEGKVRAIGVSNFTERHLAALLEDGVKVVPMINQLEVHPMFVPTATLDFCRRHGIVVQAYSPLGGGAESNVARASSGEVDGTQLLLGHETVKAIAAEVKRSPAQVLLRWGLQQGFCLVPRSKKAEHIAENAKIFDFELTDQHMDRLKALASSGQKFCWNPEGVS